MSPPEQLPFVFMPEDAADNTDNQAPPISQLEAFLQAVEVKTKDETHHRLLRACRQQDPAAALEAELSAVVTEILHET